MHGHNWIITVHCKSKTLNRNGMVSDFTHIKELIHKKLDHQNLNDVFPSMNTTAENLAKWICDNVENCYMVDVQESEGNVATYEID